MKFAIKHARPKHYLTKNYGFWSISENAWSDELTEDTTFTGAEVVKAVRGMDPLINEIKIVAVREIPRTGSTFEEVA